VDLNWRERVKPEFATMLPSFLQNLAMESARLAGLLERSDFDALARIGHNFKGSAGYFGLAELGEIACALEIYARAGDASRTAATIREWQTLLRRMELTPR
jgi:HPt (histidine-containing phosphotransfer) domain-containing protein